MAALILISSLMFAQEVPNREYKNGIDADFFGVSGYGSVNYDRILVHPKMFTFGIRAGIGTYRFRDYLLNFNPDLIFPVSIYGALGNKHKLEISLGYTFASLVQASRETFEPVRQNNANLNATIGYRFQSLQKPRLYGRAYLAFLSLNKEKEIFWPGFSIGYLVR